jgi:hypothetical protein
MFIVSLINDKGEKDMSGKVYDILKFLSAPVLPAVATLLIGFGEIWNLPIMTPIAGTLTLIATCLSTILAKVSADYFKDKEIVTTTSGVNSDGE